MNGVKQYVLSGESSVLRSLLHILATDPGAAVIAVRNDRQAQVERLVVALDEARASGLRTALSGRVLVEEDFSYDAPGPAPPPLLPDP